MPGHSQRETFNYRNSPWEKITVLKGNATLRAALVTVFVIVGISAAVFALRSNYVGVRAGKADENYIQSTDCKVCHESQFASWSRTHHSRMTQDISPETVQGDFERNNTFDYLGTRAKMERRGAGFFIDLSFSDGKKESYKIERTVGSRRIEQYVAKLNGQYFRLPVAYDLVNHRWMSLNGSFFYPDDNNYKRHFTQWDTNCVFCHNVKAQPNYDFATKLARTEVSELGIACGACHGQGAEHAESASSPITRVLWSRSPDSATRIVDPLEIDTDRSMMICGHCHGQRVPEPFDRINQILTKGDPFNAGEDLSKYYRPVHIDTKIGEFSFASRFWPDGSPRLTAYEYQGILDSACFTKGEKGNRISCSSCHTMHGGDIRGQITEEKRTNVACTQCHKELADPAAASLHSKHRDGSAGNNCYACHMPEVVYGVQTIHKTHKITTPEPVLTAEKGVPNACNQCHVDKSVNWSIEQTRALWPARYARSAAIRDGDFDLSEAVRGLFTGDALTRALMADALSKHANPAWREPFLIEAFSGDNYPIVRFFAANGLAVGNSTIAKPDYLADDNSRARQIALWASRIDPARMAEAKKIADELRKKRKDVDLEVGE